MALRFHPAAMAFSLAWTLVFAGCGGGPTSKDAPANPATATPDDHDHDHDHGHASHGPHDGDLVELGDDEYHAEVVHGEGGKLSVYILDGAAKNVVPIEATEIALNITHDGSAEQFTLTASPTESDPAGQSSRFVCDDAHAVEDLEHEGTEAKLVVTIGDVSYQGAIAHDHDHGDHGHDHGDHQH